MRETEFRALVVEEFLALIEDPRVERTRKHPLETVLVIALLAVICGADSFVAMEDFARAKEAWLGTFLDLSGGVPSHDTFGRLFAALDPRALAEAFRRWTMAMATTSNAKLIAIDGKTLRRSFKQAGDHSFVHMVSAWSRENRVVLGQVKTSEKSNEITAIPELLDLLDITNSLVTIDAAGTQTNIASKIVGKGGDYMLAVKGNQPSLQTAVTEHFQREDLSVGEHKTEKHAHGRDELREAWVSFDVENIPSADRWAGLAALVRIRSTRTLKQTTSIQDRYFICSRRVSAIEALDAVRGHWSIENELHWVLDVAFREDDSRVRAGNAAANFSAVRQLALGLLKQRTEAKSGIKNRRLRAGWNEEFLLKTIGISAEKQPF